MDMSLLSCIFGSASLGTYLHNLTCSAGACSSSSRQKQKESEFAQQPKPTAVFSRVLQELRGQQRGQASSQGQPLGTHQVSRTSVQAAQDCGADVCLYDPETDGLLGDEAPQ